MSLKVPSNPKHSTVLRAMSPLNVISWWSCLSLRCCSGHLSCCHFQQKFLVQEESSRTMAWEKTPSSPGPAPL